MQTARPDCPSVHITKSFEFHLDTAFTLTMASPSTTLVVYAASDSAGHGKGPKRSLNERVSRHHNGWSIQGSHGRPGRLRVLTAQSPSGRREHSIPRVEVICLYSDVCHLAPVATT